MKHRKHILILISLVFILVACASGGGKTATLPSTPSPTATPTPTPGIPAGTLLFQSDWSKGLAGWGTTTGWTINQGAVQSDGSTNAMLTIPATLATTNYELDVHFQVVSVLQIGGFGIHAVRAPGKDGYFANVLNLLPNTPHSPFDHPQIQVYLDPMGDMEQPMMPQVYQPGSTWHTFRIKVQGSEVDFFADAIHKGSAISSQTTMLSNGPLQVTCSGAVIRISSIQITAL